MITINLLPKELKTAKNNKLNYIFPALIIVFAILVIINVYAVSQAAIKNIQHLILTKKWEKLSPQRQEIEESAKSSSQLLQELRAVEQLTGNKLIWSVKLNKLSALLPSGIWFNEITVGNKNFLIRGSIISLKKEEMGLIRLFLSNLKQDEAFFQDFDNLVLGSVERRMFGAYEIADFIIKGSLK